MPAGLLKTLDDTWSLYYNFDQYLWSRRAIPTKGCRHVLPLRRLRRKVNPVKYSFNVGVSGDGIVPGRPHDTFGIGWSRVELSDDLLSALRSHVDIGLEREDAVEIYYNFALAKSIGLSLDLQIVPPAVTKTVSSSGGLRTSTRA